MKSFLTLYIYIYIYIHFIFERLFLYKTGYRVPFKHDYFCIKDFYTLYILLSCLVVAIDLEWLEMYIGIVLGSGLRSDEDRKEGYMLS